MQHMGMASSYRHGEAILKSIRLADPAGLLADALDDNI